MHHCFWGILPGSKGSLISQPSSFGGWVYSAFELFWSRSARFTRGRCCKAWENLLAIDQCLMKRKSICLDCSQVLWWFSSMESVELLILGPLKRLACERMMSLRRPWNPRPPQTRPAHHLVVSGARLDNPETRRRNRFHLYPEVSHSQPSIQLGWGAGGLRLHEQTWQT